MKWTFRAWHDGELVRHSLHHLDWQPRLVMVYLLDYAPAGSELRLYRGHWGSGDNLPIEHFAAERPPFAATDGPDEFEQERQRELDFVERARAPRLQRAAASRDRPQRQLGGATGP